MAESDIRRHGLEPLMQSASNNGATDTTMNIQIHAGLVHLNLRGDANDEHFLAAVEKVLGQALPVIPNTSSIDAHRVYWLGPDEWLILTDSPPIAKQLQESLTGTSAAMNDISGGQVVLRVTGSHVREVLARGCTLDFHPRTFTTGMCAQSGLAKANVLIGLADSQDAFDVVVRRSFADYLARWLQHTAAVYGVTFQDS